MNRNRLFLASICFIMTFPFLSAQENRNESDAYYGDGTGRNLRAADNNAIQKLVNAIADNYSECFDKADVFLLEEPANNMTVAGTIINTYMNYLQSASDREVISQSPNTTLKRSISKASVNEMFVLRKIKMEDMLNSASNAEDVYKIDDALRYYNWGYYLLQSLPCADTITMYGNKLIDWIPLKIDEILGKVSFVKNKTDSNNLLLGVYYDGEPVTSLDYLFFDGKDWSDIYSAKDGIGILELGSGIPDNIQVKCECNYLSEAHIDKDVNLLVDVFCGPEFHGDLKEVGTKKPTAISKSNNRKEKTEKQQTKLTLLSDEESKIYRDKIDKVLSAIESGKYSSVDDLFSLDGLDIFNKLISYGKARIVGDRNSMAFMSSNEEVICRSIPMSFSFNNNNRKFVENVNFVFNADTLIDVISFGLDQRAVDDILYNVSWSEYARKILTEFLENYKTAYSLKRIDYLRQVFDDNAVIITGKVMTRPQTDDAGRQYMDNKYVQLTRQSKEQYLTNLERCFNSNEFVNIRFAENDVVKAGKGGEIYGIQIKQDYYSSNYGDSGFLFLIVDLNDPKQPIIKVRVWQPERDPDFSGLPDF